MRCLKKNMLYHLVFSEIACEEILQTWPIYHAPTAEDHFLN